MKKILLSLGVIASSFTSFSQVIVKGVSPSSVERSYQFGVQTNVNWPSYTSNSATAADNENWGLATDFRVNGTYIQDTLALAEDGTPGVNPQGIDSTYEACSPLINNNVNGKIALLYRNTCDFASKAKNAQDKGAVAVIVVNREEETNFGMSASANGEGPNVTIPVVLLGKTDGDALRAEMANGPVVMFIGNKFGVFQNDIRIAENRTVAAPYAGANSNLNNSFDVGGGIINLGSNNQTVVNINATVTGPSGSEVYNETVNNITIGSTDTVLVFTGETYALPDFSLSSYPLGEYTLTYTVGITDSTDQDLSDNQLSYKFKINDEVLSKSTLDANNRPVATTYPLNGKSDYRSCMVIQSPDASQLGMTGVYFVPGADTSNGFQIGQEEVVIEVSEWDDEWQPSQAATWNNLNVISIGNYLLNSESQLRNVQYAELEDVVRFVDNKKYLVCAQTSTPQIYFGYDNTNDGRGNSIFRRPQGSLYTENSQGTLQWYTGYTSGVAPSIAAVVSTDASLNENTIIEGSVAPNPATDEVRISVNAKGNANLTITDLSGKIVKSNSLEMNNGVAYVNIANLEDGMYIFNVRMENGQISKINVVKR